MNIKYLNNTKTTVFHDGDIPYISFAALDETGFLTNAFSTRHGGISDGFYASMNLSYTVGDDENNVGENFRRFADAISVPVGNMVYSKQTHTVNVLKITPSHRGMGIIKPRNFCDIDGLITDVPGICLVTSFADCVPLFIADRAKKVIGLSHSGWRGTVGNIARVTVNKMKEEYQSRPEDLIAVIGPSICKSCYEVGSDVASSFSSAYTESECRDILQHLGNDKFLLDLSRANMYNFINAGIPAENISLPDICTCCNPGLLYSHRASGGRRGGMCGFLMIKDK
ncbi:MAG: peptidoglycan editing factor PgeF [Butyrivibrio sp.]